MTEPSRLLEQGATPVERALLAAAAAERPNARLKRHAIAALGLLYVAPRAAAAKAAASGGVAAGASGKVLAAQVAKWCLVFGLGGGVVAGWDMFSESNNEVTSRAVTGVLAAAPVRPVATTKTPTQPESLPPEDSVSKGEPVSAVQNSVRKPAESPSAAKSPMPAAVRVPAPSRSIRDQVALLDRARLWLSQKAPQRALAVLSTYRTRYPQGVLREEASVLRIEALRALGDREKEEAAVRRFGRSFPRSAHAERVKTGG